MLINILGRLKEFFQRGLFLVLLLCLGAVSASATSLLIVSPGESFVPGSGLSGSPNNQIAGIAFNLGIFSTNDAFNQYTSTNASGTLSSSTTTTFNPASMSLNQTFGGVAGSGYTPFITTMTPAVTGDYSITAHSANPTGINDGNKSIHVFRMTQLAYTLPASWTAGQVYYVTVTARDNVGATVTPYNGSVSFSSSNGGVNGGSTGILDTVTFSNGVGYPRIQLYYAASGITLQASNLNPNPGTVSSTTSGSITVTEGTATKFVIMGPGETAREGAASGSGRTGSISTQTVGVPFSVSVYATDDYFNRVSSGAALTLSATDLGFGGSVTGPSNLSGGVAQFNVNLRRVLTGTQTLTATGALLSDTDTVPLQNGTLAAFGFNDLSGTKRAGVAFNLVLTAYDAWGNTCTRAGSVPGAVSMSGFAGVPLDSSSISPTSIAASNFDGDGVYSGNFYVYRRAFSVVLTATQGSVNSSSSATPFDVDISLNTGGYKYLIVMPGQTYTPGERHNLIWGRNGSATNRTAGVPFNVSVVATDQYGNVLNSRSDSLTWSSTSYLNVADAAAAVDPNPIIITNGSANPLWTLTVATTSQVLSVPTSGLGLTDSGTFTVVATSIDHFAIQTTANQTAGEQYTANIIARDIYDNTVPSYNGTVYLTCPTLDYTAPTQSVIQVTGGTSNYTSGSTTANWSVAGGFSQGVLSRAVRIYRAGTGSLFVSTVAADTPSSHTGTISTNTTAITITANNFHNMFAIVPGLTHRPGADSSGNTYFAGAGYIGNPLSQQLNSPFGVTVYATDLYWNIRGDINDNFTADSNNPSSTLYNSTPAPTGFSLINGSLNLQVSFTAAQTYILIFTNPSPGISPFSTPSIQAFSIHHFTIEPLSGGWPQYWTAGVPVWVSISAHADATENPLPNFDNGVALLTSSLDHNATIQCIGPTTITFQDGVWVGQVRIYRANRTSSPSDFNSFSVVYGGTSLGTSPQFKVVPNDPDRMLIVMDGMTAYPGVNPDVWPDFKGADGQPNVQTAGSAIGNISFFLADAYWNTVTDTAKGANDPITISCSDTYPATLDGANITAGSITVNLGGGAAAGTHPGEYRSNNSDHPFVLFKVNGTTGQTIGVSHGGQTPFVLGINKNHVPVKHAAQIVNVPVGRTEQRFSFIMSYANKIAGVAFPVTITVCDAYGNTLDSLNGATPFSTFNSVNLSASTDGGGGKSIWPITIGNTEPTKWIEGISRPWIYLYKKVSGSLTLQTAYDFGAGSKSGTSLAFSVLPNDYARIVTLVPGMASFPDTNGAGGIYTGTYVTSPPPATATVFNNFGTPSQQTAGTTFTINGYSCDIYGNQINYTSDQIAMTNTDRFAPNSANVNIVPGVQRGQFTTFKFHTRGTASITVSDATVTTITAGTTPVISVVSGPFYGLQTLAPGQVAVEGSGNTMVTFMSPIPTNGWYSGVTPAEQGTSLFYGAKAQVAGTFFAVTVQAADIYGNRVTSVPADSIQLATDGFDPATTPKTGAEIFSNLDPATGRSYFFVKFGNGDAGGAIKSIRPTNATNGSIVGYPSSLTLLNIATEGDTFFKVLVNGVRAEESTPVLVEAWPNTFNVRIEVRYGAGSGEIVSIAKSFVIEPTLDMNTPPTAAIGTLGVRTGLTSFGVADNIIQSYDRAETIFLRVRDAAGSTIPAIGFSPEIRISASTPASIEMHADSASFVQGSQTIYQIAANESTRIYAQVFDANHNPVSGTNVSLQIFQPAVTNSSLGAPELITTDPSGTGYSTFYAGPQNINHVIRATAGTATADLNMQVTVTRSGGVYPNPFNPAQGQVAHIDYPLATDAAVKIFVYTLFGDQVWHAEYPAGHPEGGHAGVNSIAWNGTNDKGTTVANGGYIAVIKANDNEKFRFKIGVYKEK